MEQEWLDKAKLMADYTHANFYDELSSLYFFTSEQDAALVTRNIESLDNVIPASNSILAKTLFQLSHYFSDKSYLERAQKMLHNIQPSINDYPSGYSNWLDLMLSFTDNYYEVVITGASAEVRLKELQQHYHPNKLVAASNKASNASLLQNRFSDTDTHIFICVNNACKYPVKTVPEALKLLTKD